MDRSKKLSIVKKELTLKPILRKKLIENMRVTNPKSENFSISFVK